MNEIASDVWHVPCEPVRLPGGVRLPIASTVVRTDAGVVVYSPGAFTADQVRAIGALGKVSTIVAPNLLHHLYAARAVEAWPGATLHGAPGLARKRPELTVRELTGGDGMLGGALDLELIGGAPSINELVAFHRPSGTLLVADFLFNITQPANWQTRMVLAMTGTGGRTLKQSRVWRFAVKDRAATRASVERVLRWPVRRIAPVHGEVADVDLATLAPRLARSYGGRIASALPAAA